MIIVACCDGVVNTFFFLTRLVFDGSKRGHGVWWPSFFAIFFFSNRRAIIRIYIYILYTLHTIRVSAVAAVIPDRACAHALVGRPSVCPSLNGTTRARGGRRDTARRRPVPRRTEQRSPLCIAPRSSARRRRRSSARSLDQSAGSPPP